MRVLGPLACSPAVDTLRRVGGTGCAASGQGPKTSAARTAPRAGRMSWTDSGDDSASNLQSGLQSTAAAAVADARPGLVREHPFHALRVCRRHRPVLRGHGTGPRVVVLAHGALGSIGFAETFGLKASALAARGLRVIAYDARGHGRSGFFTCERDYDQHVLAGELLGLLDALD